MTATTHVFAGECTARFTTLRGRPLDADVSTSGTETNSDDHAGDPDRDERVHRGRVVTLVKPDDTVLVHDADGYQPVAWLTRADSVSLAEDSDRIVLTAVDGGERLKVTFDADAQRSSYPVSTAGRPVGTCPDCGSSLVRAHGEIGCLGCRDSHSLPSGATVLAEACEDCGLPQMRVRRGEVFQLCVDRGCEALSNAVEAALDCEFDCPDCGEPLRVKSYRGRQYLGCDGYPDCETSVSIPPGEVVGECVCGLPLFDTGSETRCLDGTCDHAEPSEI